MVARGLPFRFNKLMTLVTHSLRGKVTIRCWSVCNAYIAMGVLSWINAPATGWSPSLIFWQHRYGKYTNSTANIFTVCLEYLKRGLCWQLFGRTYPFGRKGTHFFEFTPIFPPGHFCKNATLAMKGGVNSTFSTCEWLHFGDKSSLDPCSGVQNTPKVFKNIQHSLAKHPPYLHTKRAPQEG